MEDYVMVYKAYGQLDGEMIRMFLESHDIPAVAYGESLGTVVGLTVGPLGEVKIYVPNNRENEAKQLLADMDAGKYDLNALYGGQPEDRPEDDVDPDAVD